MKPSLSGSSLNFTWHLGYPHGGGYRLELVDPDQDLAQLLVPVTGDENSFETMKALVDIFHFKVLTTIF